MFYRRPREKILIPLPGYFFIISEQSELGLDGLIAFLQHLLKLSLFNFDVSDLFLSFSCVLNKLNLYNPNLSSKVYLILAEEEVRALDDITAFGADVFTFGGELNDNIRRKTRWSRCDPEIYRSRDVEVVLF
ncbi:hypothetical protein ACFL7M_14760 [Thermodesulfobacteriota bacterium]